MSHQGGVTQTIHLTLPEIDEVLGSVLDRWADAVNRHQPNDVAELFHPEALFQGFDPDPGRGRSFIAAYYDKQPDALSADYELLSARPSGPGTIVGFALVQFHRPEGTVPVYLTVVLEADAGDWRISHYHVSKIATA